MLAVIGALTYADDIMLVAPTATSLNKLPNYLSICDEYARENCTVFKVAKSSLIVTPNNNRDISDCLDKYKFCVNNQPTESVKLFTLLRHTFTCDLTNDEDISNNHLNFIRSCVFHKSPVVWFVANHGTSKIQPYASDAMPYFKPTI